MQVIRFAPEPQTNEYYENGVLCRRTVLIKEESKEIIGESKTEKVEVESDYDKAFKNMMALPVADLRSYMEYEGQQIKKEVTRGRKVFKSKDELASDLWYAAVASSNSQYNRKDQNWFKRQIDTCYGKYTESQWINEICQTLNVEKTKVVGKTVKVFKTKEQLITHYLQTSDWGIDMWCGC